MSTARRLLAMSAFGLVVLFAVVVVTFGFPSLGDDEGSASSLEPCGRDARDVVLPLGVQSAAGRWQQARAFPIAQDELRAEAVNDIVYVGGGIRQSGSDLVSTNVFFAFDPATGTYRKLRPLPRRVDHPGFVAAGGDLYLIGGFHDGVPTGEMFAYSPRTRTWRQLASMGVPRGSPAAAAIGRHIYVSGGNVANREARDASTDVVEIYDRSTGRWSRGPVMPTARHHAGAAAIGTDVYVVGGRARRDLSLDVVERYDSRTRRWETAPHLPQGVGALALVAARGRLVAIGGGDDIEEWVTPGTWSFEPATERWRRLSDLREARHGHAAAAVGDEIYVFGGAPCPGYGRSDSVEMLTLGS
jgi:hypothetical protein